MHQSLLTTVGIRKQGSPKRPELTPKIWKKKDVEEFKPDPYLATILNCALWVFYGIPVVHPNSILVVTINGIGLVVESIYLTIFFVYSPKRKRMKMLAVLGVEAVFMVAVILGVILGAHTHAKRSLIVGVLCVFFGTCMYASPLTIMRKVIATKSVEYMPFFLSLVCFLNGVCWTAYALIRFDIFVTIPNGLGALFGLVQLILYFCYYGSTPKKDKNVELPTVISLLNTTTTPAMSASLWSDKQLHSSKFISFFKFFLSF